MSNDDIVRRIAAEVIRRLASEEEKQADAPSPSGTSQYCSCKKPLILFTGGNACTDEALAELECIAEGCESLTVVLSPSAEKVLGAASVRRRAPNSRIITEGDPEKILEETDAVFLPNMSLNAASKISAIIPDSLVCILAIHSMMRGLPVYASCRSLVPEGIDPGRIPAGLRARIKKYLEHLQSYGMKLSHAGIFESAAQNTPAASSAGSKAPVASGISVSAACDRSQTGDCAACGMCVEKTPVSVGAIVSSGADRIGAAMGTMPSSPELASIIDHTILKPDASESDIRKICEEAAKHTFASVCVNPGWVSLASKLLAGTPVKVCTVIGFPLGATTPTSKALETRDAIANGATEIDMVINVGALKSGNDDLVRRDIEAVVEAAGGRAIVKVILETALLTKEEKVKACLLCKMAGADFVKTSTGFSTGGATVEDIALMRETVGPEMGVKASGGIRDRDTAEAMVAAGATRIGASASVAIATGSKDTGKGY